MATMVTRTKPTTSVEVLCLNTETAEACNVSLTFVGEHDSESAKKLIDKAVKEAKSGNAPSIFPEFVEPVKVVHTAVTIKRYGMTEQKFIDNAEELEPRKTNN